MSSSGVRVGQRTARDPLVRVLLYWIAPAVPALLPALARANEPASTATAIGVLPTQGPQPLCGKLSSELPDAIRRTVGGVVFGPAQVVAKLAAAKGASEALDTARLVIGQAESHEFKMERGLALESSRRAIDVLRAAGARFYAPQLWTVAHLALTQAELLRPPDPLAARAALREVVAANPQLGADKYPPRVGRLLEQVRGDQTPTQPPGQSELAGLSLKTDLGRLVYVDARPLGDQVAVRLALYDRLQGSHAVVERRIKNERLSERVAQLVAWMLGPGAAAVVVRQPATPASRWYRRWWVWAAAGAAAAAVAAGVVASTVPGDEYSFRLRTSR